MDNRHSTECRWWIQYFLRKGNKIFLEAANPAYEPIELDLDQVVFQGKLLAVWRKV